ncbi:uncharacterized protein LOC129746180 [Uranotaenia lowii]|uniref:uncharacterized protein LOC129746180 n=1 Tax=Uranotaenia lowii TaxID=190385 RepID=UPI00247A3558|nr:uncharacterized protein LOC129746180 [Uranotaenia lowii]
MKRFYKFFVLSLVLGTISFGQISCQQENLPEAEGSGNETGTEENLSFEDYYTGHSDSKEEGNNPSDDYYPGVWYEDDYLDGSDLEKVDFVNATLLPIPERATDVTDEPTTENPISACPPAGNDGNLTSPGFPKPYPSQMDCTWIFSIEAGSGIEVVVHQLNLSHKTDYLFIKPGYPDEADEKGIMLTGYLEEPYKLLISHRTTFTVQFVSNHTEQDDGAEPLHDYPGYRLTYVPFGQKVSPAPPTTTEAIVPQEVLQWIQRTVTIQKSKQLIISTWDRVKETLANATNEFLGLNNWPYQQARAGDIKLQVRRCPETWPNFEECVTLKFAIPLRPNVTTDISAPPVVPAEENAAGARVLSDWPEARGFITITSTEAPDPVYELSERSLEQMWNQFGVQALAAEGVQEYLLQENSSVVYIWIGISLCVLLAFIFVLYSIWKIDIFKDYRRITKMRSEVQDDDRSELKKKEFDISMFPSPHQIVPSLFPTGDPFGDRRSTDAYYAYDNSAMKRWAEEEEEKDKFDERDFPTPRKASYEPFSPAPMEFSAADFDPTTVQNTQLNSGKPVTNQPFHFPEAPGEDAPGSRKFSSLA